MSMLLNALLKDPFYGSAYPLVQSVELMKKAGFIYHERDESLSSTKQFESKWLTTPVDKIINRLSVTVNDLQKPLVVLLSTGSFCPIHKSHIAMMEAAKKELESRGSIVLGGYFSPSHDHYVSHKCQQGALSASHRIRLCEEATVDSHWLMTDCWESMYTTVPINFSDVISRLEHYLAKHVASHNTINVVYVFGSDNAEFAYAFLKYGRCVCIKRSGYEEQFDALKCHELIKNNVHITLATDGTDQYGFSSRNIRQGNDDAVIDAVKDLYKAWEKNKYQPKNIEKAVYFLRNEGRFTYSRWETQEGRLALKDSWNDFLISLCAVIRHTFKFAQLPDKQREVDIQLLDIHAQRKLAANIMASNKVISLDPCIQGDINLGVSRCFLASVGKYHPDLIARPGWQSLAIQIAAIPPGEYCLIDDDISTGTTIKKVMSLLPETVKITQVIALSSDTFRTVDQPFIDISDSRDFLIGSQESGLVIKLPNGKLARAPYMLPYVFPSDRAKTPLADDKQLSYALWEINVEFFKKIQPAILLKEANAAFQELMFYVGFTEDDSLQSICEWHMDRLIRSFH